MRSKYLPLLAVTVATVAAFVDEEHSAVVIEAASEASTRSGRQFWSYLPVTSRTPGTGFPVYPAGTQPLSPIANALCRTTSGQLAWCNQYQVPGIIGWPGTGGQYPGFGGQYPGFGGQYPGFGGQYPGQFPGAEGQYPGQYPGAGGQYPGGFPGQPGGQPAPVPVPAPAPTPVPAVPAVPEPTPATTPAPSVPAIIQEVDNDVTEVEESAPSFGECGRAKYFPIRYAQNGSVAEEVERVNCEGACNRIVAGWDADKYEWPWIAALMNNGRQFCGGSLIDNKHILTAAHCVAHMSRYDVANLMVRLGEYEIKTQGETQLFESKAARVVRHKEFSQQTLHKDVAIITLETPVPDNLPNIRPVCLASGSQTYDGETATVIGWGSLRENGPQPNTLQEMTVKIWNNRECKETYGNAAPGGITDHMLCAGKQGKDSCSGDSGGPMQIGAGKYWHQIGVVSWGIGCGKSHYPGVYTRVTEVRDWIDRILKEY